MRENTGFNFKFESHITYYTYLIQLLAETFIFLQRYKIQLYIHSSVYGHLDCFLFLAMMDRAPINMDMQVSLCKHLYLIGVQTRAAIM